MGLLYLLQLSSQARAAHCSSQFGRQMPENQTRKRMIRFPEDKPLCGVCHLIIELQKPHRQVYNLITNQHEPHKEVEVCLLTDKQLSSKSTLCYRGINQSLSALFRRYAATR